MMSSFNKESQKDPIIDTFAFMQFFMIIPQGFDWQTGLIFSLRDPE